MKVSWRPGARQDLREIADLISRERPAAALRVVQRIETRIRQLVYFPDAGRSGRGKFRELVITRTPYIALYVRHEDEIEIVHVFHGARDR